MASDDHYAKEAILELAAGLESLETFLAVIYPASGTHPYLTQAQASIERARELAERIDAARGRVVHGTPVVQD